MKLIFTKISPTHHTLCVCREGLKDDIQNCETRSLMPHDLIHFAYEKTVWLKNSFWGLLSQWYNIEHFPDELVSESSELYRTEMIVGPLTWYLMKEVSEAQVISYIQNACDAYGIEVPQHITTETLKLIKIEYERLWWEWRSLPWNQEMILTRNE